MAQISEHEEGVEIICSTCHNFYHCQHQREREFKSRINWILNLNVIHIFGVYFLPFLNLACKLFNAKASHEKVFMQEIFTSTVSKSYKLDCNYRNLIFF